MSANYISPAVQRELNVAVINKITEAAAQVETSGIEQIANFTTTVSEENVVTILGVDFEPEIIPKNSDVLPETAANMYEQRGLIDRYARIWSLDRTDVLFDKIGRVMATAALIGQGVGATPARMIENSIIRALDYTCHTGAKFFSAAHPIKPSSSTTFSNLFNLGALDFDTFDQAVARFAAIPGDDGEPLGRRPKYLVVSGEHKGIGEEICSNPEPREYPGKNLRAGKYELVVVDRWYGDNLWGLFDTSLPEDGPLHFIEAMPLTNAPLYEDMNGSWEREHNRLKWMLEGFLQVQLGNPRRALLNLPSLDHGAIATLVAKYKRKKV